MSSGEFHFHDELASLFAQRPAAPGPGDMMAQQQQQAPASWFADYYLLCRALDLPVPGDDVVKRELLVVDTGGGGGGFGAPTPTPSGGGTAPVTPNTTSSTTLTRARKGRRRGRPRPRARARSGSGSRGSRS